MPSVTRAELVPDGWIRGAPEVAVEALSSSNLSSAVQRKTLEYLEAEARLVWIVDPGARTVLVRRPDGSARLLRGSDALGGEDVLPTFSMGLNEVFG